MQKASSCEPGQAQEAQSTLVSRNITIFNKRTSVRLEPEMWQALKEISERECCTIHDVCSLISLRKRPRTSLTAAIRVFIMLYFKAAATEKGHQKAGHGNFELLKIRARIPSEKSSLFANKGASGPQALVGGSSLMSKRPRHCRS